MTDLLEHQHELSETDGTGPVLFGTEDTGYLTLTRPLVVAGEVRASDRERPQEDGTAFGRDYRGSKSYSFELGVLTDLRSVGTMTPLRTNLDYLGDLEAVWTDEKWRNRATAYAMLRSCEGGETVRCYGRPRRWEEAVGNLTKQGFTPVMAVFDLVDGKWYDDTEDSVTVTIEPSSEGGFAAPFPAPITTTRRAETSADMTVGGKVPTWPIIEFHGPVARPTVTVGPLVIGLATVIADGDVVTFDPRPWVRTVLAADGSNQSGKIIGRTPAMRDCFLRPGAHPITYEGYDVTGTSTITVRWRDARPRP